VTLDRTGLLGEHWRAVAGYGAVRKFTGGYLGSRTGNSLEIHCNAFDFH
jgi:hypothetical protein